MTPATLIEHLAGRGIRFELVDDAVEVVGADRLTDDELATLREYRDALHRFLTTDQMNRAAAPGSVISVTAANDSPAPVTTTTRAALTARYGPTVQIAATLAEAREVRLAELLALIDEATAATLTDTAALLDVARRLVGQGRLRPVVYRRVIPGPSGVRCIDCRHHRRTEHPRLVDCAAGVEPTNPTRLFWATDRRGCEAFEPADPARNDEPVIEGELLRDDDDSDPHDEHRWRQRFDAEMAYGAAVPVNVPCSCGGSLVLLDSPRPPMAAGKPELMRRADGRVEWTNVVGGDDIARQRADLRYRCKACGSTVRHGQMATEATTC